MKHSAATLEDKYQVDSDRFFLTGSQALVRLPMLQRQLDQLAGLNTGGFISGYRGSPLGGVDIQMWTARKPLEAAHIHFRPAVNEELAATAIWGSQQLPLLPGAKYDGVFAYWYGKGPGVDRSGDVFRHANYAGTARHGGVLVMAGDDHGCKSSTVPHQSELALVAASMPILVPADLNDILEFGLHGWAMSRWCGRWVGFKLVGDVMDSSASVAFDLAHFRIVLPDGPHPDVGIRASDIGGRIPVLPLDQEARTFTTGLSEAQRYVRANGLDRTILNPIGARIGIITAGKSYQDTRQAFSDLGMPEPPDVRLLKLALTWPIDPETLRRFAQGLDEIIVVEEKAALIEQQVRDILYDAPHRPRVLGKRGPDGAPFLKSHGEFSSAEIALAIGARLGDSETLRANMARLRTSLDAIARAEVAATRKPYFGSGCPHNTSTRVIDGSRALGGIGCHTLAVWMDRNTDSFSQMGGEGVAWLGQAPFTEEKHVFANMGDGTYFHSGYMAIRAAVANGANITYKILFNDAVAMTGGQPIDGIISVPQITRQVAAEGVKTIVVVTDEPDKYDDDANFAPGVEIRHRRDMDQVAARLRDTPGCSVLVYDQTCASEKRRRRKRGTFPDPAKRIFINAAVCEGCGDCSRASNCLSVQPLETAFGTKRVIDQSSCNKDFSCVEGFCPSFVTVHGAEPRKRARVTPEDFGLPIPRLPELRKPWNILVTGIGGTGIVTIGALIGMAAHLDGKHVTVLDQTGLSQKAGGVTSHIRLAEAADKVHGLKVARGGADLLLACDMVVAAGKDALASYAQGVTHAVLNTHETPTGDFVLDTTIRLPSIQLRRSIVEAVGGQAVDQLDATAIATGLMGDSIATNPFLLGYAWQKGLVPLTLESLLRAIELNGTAVEANKAAFTWGRCAAVDLARVQGAAGLSSAKPEPVTLDGIIASCAAQLVLYQNQRYAGRYTDLVGRVREIEGRIFSGSTALTEAVAKGYHKLLAYKDEYEVARLYASEDFKASLAAQFETPQRIEIHLAPPLLAKRDPHTGHMVKRSYGRWMLSAFGLLQHLRFLRGTRLDVFGRTEERRMERDLITEYEADIAAILAQLGPATLATAVALASLPEQIKGFGHVKERTARLAAAERGRLLDKLRAPAARMAAA